MGSVSFVAKVVLWVVHIVHLYNLDWILSMHRFEKFIFRVKIGKKKQNQTTILVHVISGTGGSPLRGSFREITNDTFLELLIMQRFSS